MALESIGLNLFREAAAFDDLIHINRTVEPHKLSYDQEVFSEREDFYESLTSAPPLFVNSVGRPVALNGVHRGGTCILVGSGPSLNIEFIRTLQEQGVCVITMGNAAYTYKAADYWIGIRDPQQYSPNPFLESRTKAILPLRCKQEPLWDFINKRPTHHILKDCPGVLFYKDNKESRVKKFFQTPHITDFGYDTTLGLGLSLAICLGFSNIILSGVDMGGELASYYCFDEMPHKDIYTRKSDIYSKFITGFKPLLTEMLRRAIRLVSSTPTVFDIPYLSEDYLKRVTTKIAYLHMPPLSSPRGLTIPISTRKSYVDIFNTHRSRRVDVMDFKKIHAHLKEVAPEFFDMEGVQSAYDLFEEKLGQSGCSNCAARRLLKPIYDLFVEYYTRDPVEFSTVWATIFPDKYTLLLEGVLVFREDMKHLEDEMLNLAPR